MSSKIATEILINKIRSSDGPLSVELQAYKPAMQQEILNNKSKTEDIVQNISPLHKIINNRIEDRGKTEKEFCTFIKDLINMEINTIFLIIIVLLFCNIFGNIANITLSDKLLEIIKTLCIAIFAKTAFLGYRVMGSIVDDIKNINDNIRNMFN